MLAQGRMDAGMSSKLHKLVQEGGAGSYQKSKENNNARGGGGGEGAQHRRKESRWKGDESGRIGTRRDDGGRRRRREERVGIVAQLAQGLGVEEETVEALGYAVAAAAAAYSVWRRARG